MCERVTVTILGLTPTLLNLLQMMLAMFQECHEQGLMAQTQVICSTQENLS